MKRPPGFGTVAPYIFIRDAERYLEFLRSAFDAVELGRTQDDNGRIANAQVRIGTTSFMVAEASDSYPPSRAALYLFVADADRAMAQALTHGATLEMDVSDMPYGDRQGGVVDPCGNIWWISQRLVDGAYY